MISSANACASNEKQEDAAIHHINRVTGCRSEHYYRLLHHSSIPRAEIRPRRALGDGDPSTRESMDVAHLNFISWPLCDW